jgi:hypothetical protein
MKRTKHIQHFPTATEPGAMVCFTSIPLKTLKDGTVHAFLIMDAYSKYMLHVGVELGDDMEYVLKHIQRMIQSSTFSQFGHHPFVLVMAGYEAYRPEIEALIEPIGGRMLVDEGLVMFQMAEAIEDFLRSVQQGMS